jgi:hypothetical protein
LRDKKKWKRMAGINKFHGAALDDDAANDDGDSADEAGNQMKTKKKKKESSEMTSRYTGVGHRHIGIPPYQDSLLVLKGRRIIIS